MNFKSWKKIKEGPLGRKFNRFQVKSAKRENRFLKILRGCCHLFSNLFLNNGINIRAGALTYLTLSGFVPICVFFAWFADYVMAEISLLDFIKYIIPELYDSFGPLREFPKLKFNQLHEDFSVGPIGGILIITIILGSVYAFLNNLHIVFNHIWRSEDITQNYWECAKKNLAMIIIIGFTIIFATFIYSFITSPIIHHILTLIIVALCVFFAFRYLPHDRRPHIWPNIISAISVTGCLFFWTQILVPIIGASVSEFEFFGVDILLLVLWLYWSWFIILTGARASVYYSFRGGERMGDTVNRLVPVYRQFILLQVASFIFKNYNSQKGVLGCSFKEIREGFSKAVHFNPSRKQEEDKTVQQEQKKHKEHKKKKRYSFLPMILLDSIMNELVDKKIIHNAKENPNRFVPYYDDNEPEISIDEKSFTVGDFFFRLNFVGEHDLLLNYYLFNNSKANDLCNSYMNICAKDNERLIDLELSEISGEEFDGMSKNPFIFKNTNECYNRLIYRVNNISSDGNPELGDNQLKDKVIPKIGKRIKGLVTGWFKK